MDVRARARQEVKDLIRFYERRGRDWLLAAEFHLYRLNGGEFPIGRRCGHKCGQCTQREKRSHV
jgi:hypothetical protein